MRLKFYMKLQKGNVYQITEDGVCGKHDQSLIMQDVCIFSYLFLLTKNFFLFAKINLTTRGPLYTLSCCPCNSVKSTCCHCSSWLLKGHNGKYCQILQNNVDLCQIFSKNITVHSGVGSRMGHLLLVRVCFTLCYFLDLQIYTHHSLVIFLFQYHS